MKILLTGIRSPVTLDLAACFSACGHRVHGADSLNLSVARSALDSMHVCAPPAQRFDAFAADAEALVSRLQPDLIIPLCEDIFHWQLAAQSREWPLFAPSLPVLMQLHSKYAFVELALSLGLRAPDTRRLVDGESVEAPDRYIFKPEFSRFGACIVSRPRHMPALQASPENPWLRQDFIAGEDISFHAIARDGRLRAFTAYRSVWRARGGASYHFAPVELGLACDLEAIAAKLAAGTGLTGQFACDLRRDGDNQLWLIECNPRATSGLHLLAHDLKGLCNAFVAREAQICRDDGGPACLAPAMWLYGLPTAFKNGQLRAWQHDLRHSRDVLAARGWAAMSDAARLATQAALSGRSLQAFLTADIECNRDLSCA